MIKIKCTAPETNDYTLEELLSRRNISNVEDFLVPSKDFLQDPLLSNIDDAANLLLTTCAQHRKIIIVEDCDTDGITSAVILYMYIRDYLNTTPLVLFHTGKQHGLEDLYEEIGEKYSDYSLIITPDAGTNDKKYHEYLSNFAMDILVLDHHELDEGSEEDGFADNAIIVNNQLSPDYKNKSLTGVGVVYQFIRFLDCLNGTNAAKNYTDLVAVGLVADTANITSLENKYLIDSGLLEIKNKCLQAFVEKQSFSIGGNLNYTTIAFYIAPLLNAIIRVGTQEEKERLFYAFVEPNRIVTSNKRGEKGLETSILFEVTREATNARSKQNKIKEKISEELEIDIAKNSLLDNKILFIVMDSTKNFPSTLNGLIAMELAEKYKRPTILVRDSDTVVKGSIRGSDGCELTDLKRYLTDTGLFDYVSGHPNAAGCCIDKSKIDKFISQSNKELVTYDFSNSQYEVEYLFKDKESLAKLGSLIYNVGNDPALWGNGNPEPKIGIEDFPMLNYQIIGKNSNTLKFMITPSVTGVMFFATKIIQKLKDFEEPIVTIVGRASINHFNGESNPQLIVSVLDVREGKFDF